MLDDTENNNANTRNLVDAFLRETKDPADTSRHKQLAALLESPNTELTDSRMKELARLLQDETVGTKTREIITDYVTQSPVSSLPRDVTRTSIGRHLEKNDRVAFGVASFGLFCALYGNLFKLVTNGSETSANLLLKKSNILESSILKKNHCTDPGGRTFKNISPLQYAYWMGDWYMVDMLLSNLSIEQLAEAQKQIDEVKNSGIEYQLYLDIDASVEPENFAVEHLAPVILPQENVEYHISLPPADYQPPADNLPPDGKRRVLVTVKGEQHYDYQPLIKALRDFLLINQQWKASNFNDNNLGAEVRRHWCNIVGLVQHHATAFLAQQYCHPTHTFKNATFDEPEFKNRSLNLSVPFRTDDINPHTYWFLRRSGIGVSFGILRPTRRGGARRWDGTGETGGRLPSINADLAAVELLYKVSPEKMMRVLDKHFARLSHITQPG